MYTQIIPQECARSKIINTTVWAASYHRHRLVEVEEETYQSLCSAPIRSIVDKSRFHFSSVGKNIFFWVEESKRYLIATIIAVDCSCLGEQGHEHRRF